jgi:prophage tail gpP-like protein
MIEVRSNGIKITGWKSATINKSIDNVCHVFSIKTALTNKNDIFPLLPLDPVSIYYKNVLVMTGYVDELDGDHPNYTISGRSKASDLVDCTAIVKTGSFKNQTVLQIANALAEPFGISAKTSKDDTTINTLRVEGNTCFEVLEKACRMRGVLTQSLSDGNVDLSEIGKEELGISLIAGGNIKSSSIKISVNNRFSDYKTESSAHKSESTATDSHINRYRPLIINTETTGIDTKSRASFEASTRKARSTIYNCTVQGWGVDGNLWEPNKSVYVLDEKYGVDTNLLITQVQFTFSTSGTETQLQLVPLGSFTIEPIKQEKRSTKSVTTSDEWKVIWKQ